MTEPKCPHGKAPIAQFGILGKVTEPPRWVCGYQCNMDAFKELEAGKLKLVTGGQP